MRIPRIYQAIGLAAGTEVEVREQQAHHLLKVLRCQPGNPVILFNGDGCDYSAEILSTGRHSLRARVTGSHALANESPLRIHLGIPLARGQRMDYAIQKAVELGVERITPLMTERSVVKLDTKRLDSKHEHWQQVIISACEQCGRARVPELHPLLALPEWSHSAGFGVVLDPDDARSLKELQPPVTPVHLVAGPEGGLTAQEIAMLRTAGFHGVKLGQRILRTETAPVAALAAMQLLWGDF